MSAEQVRVADIQVDPEIQSRAKIDESTVREYAADMTDGTTFDPVELFRDEGGLWIGDGNHRVLAASRVPVDFVAAIVKPGGRQAALLCSLGANQNHRGLRRSRADKRASVSKALADSEIGLWGDSQIAKLTGTSHTFVANMRRDCNVSNLAHIDTRSSLAPSQRITTTATVRLYPAEEPARTATVYVTDPGPYACGESPTRSVSVVNLDPGDDEELSKEFVPVDPAPESDETFLASLKWLGGMPPSKRDAAAADALMYREMASERKRYQMRLRESWSRFKRGCGNVEPRFLGRQLYLIRMRGPDRWAICVTCKGSGVRTVAGEAIPCCDCGNDRHGYQI